MQLYFFSFVFGVLTVITPCVLPVLPVILGGSLSGRSRWRPLVITASLLLTVFLFTIFIKATSVLFIVPAWFWTTLAVSVLATFGFILLFPELWTRVSMWLGLEKSQEWLSNAQKQESWWGVVLLGVALGPVFTSCSPTYALILTTVLPQAWFVGVIALLFYCLGLAFPLLLIAYAGRWVFSGFKMMANPKGWFRKGVGVLFILLAVAIASGADKKIEAWILNQGIFDVTEIEQQFIDTLDTDQFSAQEGQQEHKALVQLSDVEHLLLDKPFTVKNFDEYDGFLLNTSDPPEQRDTSSLLAVYFWNLSCAECLGALSFFNQLSQIYNNQGLEVLLVHVPELSFEKNPVLVARTLQQYQLDLPVFIDNTGSFYRDYHVEKKPVFYLINTSSNTTNTSDNTVVFKSQESTTLQDILMVVDFFLQGTSSSSQNVVSLEQLKSLIFSEKNLRVQETFLGLWKLMSREEVLVYDDNPYGVQFLNSSYQLVFSSPEHIVPDSTQQFSAPKSPGRYQWWLNGKWEFPAFDKPGAGQFVELKSEKGVIGMSVESKDIYLVLETPLQNRYTGQVMLEGFELPEHLWGTEIKEGTIKIEKPGVYHVFHQDEVKPVQLEIQLQTPKKNAGIKLYALQFL